MDRPTLPGKYAIATMLLLGVAAAVYTQMYYSRMQKRPMELWGAQNAHLIMNAPLVSAMLLGPADAKGSGPTLERLMVGGEHFTVMAERTVSNQPGLSHVRQALVNDASFTWAKVDSDCKPEWEYALEFSDGERRALICIAPNCDLVRLTDTGATADAKPVMNGIEEFFRELFPKK